MSDFIKRLLPRDTLPVCAASFSFSFKRIFQAIRMIDVFRRGQPLNAHPPLIKRRITIPFHLDEFAVPDIKQRPASAMAYPADTSVNLLFAALVSIHHSI